MLPRDSTMTEIAIRRLNVRFDRTGFLLSAPLLILMLVSVAVAQKAETLSNVKKVYVGSLGNAKGADAIRHRIADRLRASHKVEVVSTQDEADATVTGSGQVWVTGHISASARASGASSQGVYDGFLSVDIIGKGGSTLWSYLVTPSSFPLKGITSDLADQLVKKLLEALPQRTQEAATPVTDRGGASVSLHGAGATFPWPVYKKWFESFEQKDPHVRIRYDPIGSQSGIQLLSEGKIDFAASDMPLSDEAMAQSPVRFRHFASVLGAVVPIYNLKKADRYLKFTPEALAGIYLGTIKKWNDRAIRNANPGIDLPDTDIVVVHRSDGSGTSFVWTDYLSKVSPKWKESVGAGTDVRWPAGVGAEGNEGVATFVGQTPNSIGYVELIYAIQHEIHFGAVRNSSGTFIKAGLSSVTEAAGAAGAVEGANRDFRVSITNPSAKQAYPISTFTWLLLPAAADHTEKTNTLHEFLRWMLTAGQKQCAGLGYAPLPAAVANQELQMLDRFK
jgi:phosphate ABC transporter phosphate-binding protein